MMISVGFFIMYSFVFLVSFSFFLFFFFFFGGRIPCAHGDGEVRGGGGSYRNVFGCGIFNSMDDGLDLTQFIWI